MHLSKHDYRVPESGATLILSAVDSMSTEKRYDSIGSAPAGIVGVGSALIPGHFRLGRLNEAAGVCGGRGPSMGFELGS
jgi:hypothetical protein